MVKKMTLEKLATMTQKGFDGMDKRFGKVDERLDKMNERLEKVEKRMARLDAAIFLDHKH
jgi:archaellum component FlaC